MTLDRQALAEAAIRESELVGNQTEFISPLGSVALAILHQASANLKSTGRIPESGGVTTVKTPHLNYPTGESNNLVCMGYVGNLIRCLEASIGDQGGWDDYVYTEGFNDIILGSPYPMVTIDGLKKMSWYQAEDPGERYTRILKTATEDPTFQVFLSNPHENLPKIALAHLQMYVNGGYKPTIDHYNTLHTQLYHQVRPAIARPVLLGRSRIEEITRQIETNIELARRYRR